MNITWEKLLKEQPCKFIVIFFLVKLAPEKVFQSRFYIV
jgi:hypothetical protein